MDGASRMRTVLHSRLGSGRDKVVLVELALELDLAEVEGRAPAPATLAGLAARMTMSPGALYGVLGRLIARGVLKAELPARKNEGEAFAYSVDVARLAELSPAARTGVMAPAVARGARTPDALILVAVDDAMLTPTAFGVLVWVVATRPGKVVAAEVCVRFPMGVEKASRLLRELEAAGYLRSDGSGAYAVNWGA